jgi:hypothetical protein
VGSFEALDTLRDLRIVDRPDIDHGLPTGLTVRRLLIAPIVPVRAFATHLLDELPVLGKSLVKLRVEGFLDEVRERDLIEVGEVFHGSTTRVVAVFREK